MPYCMHLMHSKQKDHSFAQVSQRPGHVGIDLHVVDQEVSQSQTLQDLT